MCDSWVNDHNSPAAGVHGAHHMRIGLYTDSCF